jgi:hypothetical protein
MEPSRHRETKTPSSVEVRAMTWLLGFPQLQVE